MKRVKQALKPGSSADHVNLSGVGAFAGVSPGNSNSRRKPSGNSSSTKLWAFSAQASSEQDLISGNEAENGFSDHQDNNNLSETSPFKFKKSLSFNSLKGTLKKKKDKNVSLVGSWREEDDRHAARSTLPPPMPPIAPAPRLRRVNSSTMSLGRNKKKLLTLEELYVEILYTILHMIGCDAEREEQKLLLEHLKQAFHMSDEKHTQLLDIASMREEPYLKANLELIEARNLLGKDMSGSSDPFCTFYMTTNPLSRFNTSYKAKTLNPVWNEEFVLDVNSVDNDSLRVDVWDFNPEENVSDKFRKINEIKDSRGLRRFIKETLNASAGKTSHELIGSVEISLKDVPSSGMNKWLPLEKPEAKSKRKRGDVHVTLILSTEKDQNLTSQEHKHLLKILFAHELQKTQEEPFTWNGTFSKESVTILGQHAVQGKLTGAETALARWLVYAHTHCDLPLDYRVFVPILDQLKYAITNNLLHQDDETKFIETAGIFTHHCIEFLRKHRQFVASDSKMLIQLDNIVRCLQLLSSTIEGREAPSNRDGLYEISEHRHMVSFTASGHIKSLAEDAVAESTEHWYRYIVESLPMDNSRAMRVKNIIRLVQIILSDLKQGCKTVGHDIFKDPLDINYLQIAFNVYQREITDAAKDLIGATCEKLKPIVFTEDDEDDCVNDTLTLGTSLFELYLSLQELKTLGETYGENQSPQAQEFFNNHTWFSKGVARWLDIALYKAMQRIIKAVELDDLEPIDALVKHSSSAVDIQTVLLQIKTFWKQLDWPDVEASYAFISKILDDVCKTTIFYAEQMCKRVANHDKSKKFEVTSKLCLAINNIDYVYKFINPFVKELGMEETLEKLEVLNGDVVANSCRRTLTTLVQNALENVENKILEVLDMVGEKMAPVIQKFLIEGSSLVSYAAKHKESLIQYLDKNMIVLKDDLNETNFNRILSVIWESSAQSISDTINLSIDCQKPPSYFKTLLDILNVLINFFYGDKLPQDETLLKMKSLLQMYAADSCDLISRYFWERYQDQNSLKDGNYTLGSITIRCQLLREHLRVEILNARHLKPLEYNPVRMNDKYLSGSRRRRLSSSQLYNSSLNLEWVKCKFKFLKSNLHEASLHFHTTTSAGQCDPYVTLRLVPENRFPHGPKFRTRVHRRTLFPLFDETFDFVISHGGTNRLQDTYLQLVVKDKSLIGTGLFLGEALIPLTEIPNSDMDQKLIDLPQMQVPLTRPTDNESDLMLALDSRNFDRIAKDFLTKEKKKLI